MTWDQIIKTEKEKAYYKQLEEKLAVEEKNYTIYPKQTHRFSFMNLTPFEQIKVVIIGQDPYHNVGQAHGLAFSVLNESYPPSLKNIFKELESDLKIKRSTGNLSGWATQGVLLLNTVLTVRAHQANSHQSLGWQQFTKEIIHRINKHREHVVFILWGNHAKQYQKEIDLEKHLVLLAPHPSPLSSYLGFFGSKPFSQTNEYLIKTNQVPIDWSK